MLVRVCFGHYCIGGGQDWRRTTRLPPPSLTKPFADSLPNVVMREQKGSSQGCRRCVKQRGAPQVKKMRPMVAVIQVITVHISIITNWGQTRVKL